MSFSPFPLLEIIFISLYDILGEQCFGEALPFILQWDDSMYVSLAINYGTLYPFGIKNQFPS